MTLMMDVNTPVWISVENGLMTLTLNRPKAINSLNLDIIQSLQKAMDEAARSPEIRLVLIRGEGDKGFCAGADVKAASQAVAQGRKEDAMRFFIEEYALDLCIHRFPKPLVVLAHGITMGGGLGLAAGADLVLATDTTRMAMPETRIGFFPDVGATGWLFEKCPEGYAEYLALTGYEVEGPECVRLGLAHEWMDHSSLRETMAILKNLAGKLASEKDEARQQIRKALDAILIKTAFREIREEDLWVKENFSGRESVPDILLSLSRSKTQTDRCQAALKQFSERSPTAAVLTLWLLRQNQNQPLEAVFQLETRATRFIISHPDYREGVRARLVDKDNQPKWQPDRLDQVILPALGTGS
jgi:enoyl-CoA hydratase/carnithine racemase